MHTNIRLFLFAISALLCGAQGVDRPRLHAAPAASKGTQTGPAIGTKIPAFALADQNGQVQTFEKLRGPKGMLLVFFRSADWCPYCKSMLVDLNREAAAYTRQGLRIVAVSYDSVAILQNFAERQKIAFPLLSDAGSKTIRAFGILNTNIQPGDPSYGIPFPGSYVVDAKGVIKSKYFEDDYTERYSGAAILTHEKLAGGAEKITAENQHLKLSYSASDATFAPGRKIALVLELEMKPKMHVYAPGVQGYIPVDWKMADAKTFIAFPAEFPKSRMLHLPAIQETVPVFDGKLRIVRDITIGNEREIAGALSPERALTVEGTFHYQACDDKKCYVPEAIPLKWTFRVGTMDTQRAPAEIRVRP
jgi:peroxiredoxin